MNFKEIEVPSFIVTYGDDNISEVITPLLSRSKRYSRSVGFFSSSSFEVTKNGVAKLIQNGGSIRFIASPYISEKDKDAILLGYEKREDVYIRELQSETEKALAELDDNNLELLIELITMGKLDIKIVKTKGIGDYHDKLAILEDEEGNIISFSGSSNETSNGLRDNYERNPVFKSWITGQQEYVNANVREFEDLWNGTHKYNDTFDFTEAFKQSILKVRHTKSDHSQNKVEPYEYQKDAINAWVQNNYNGFFVMATGTGKTLTSLFALRKLLDNKSVFTVIAVPYKHLVSQWSNDVKLVLPDVKTILVTGEIKDWDKRIQSILIKNKYAPKKESVIIISTIVSFYSERFAKCFKYNSMETCLIVDEAHNFLSRIYEKKFFIDYDYRLGLSATPIFGNNIDKTNDLLDFFGGEVYSLPIEKAIGKYLVNYKYHTIYVDATCADEEKFKMYTRKMASCMRDGFIIDEVEYTKAYRGRLRAISMAENKLIGIENYIKEINAKDHFIIYCSDGHIDDKDSNMSIRHLNKVVTILNGMGYDSSQFTATENMNVRMSLIDSFNRGDIHTLVAIRCLDEGVNIPSIEKALILSSNNNYREFVQRRGRILRKYPGKTIADIYDVVLLPKQCPDIAKIELKRVYEYAKVALNKTEIFQEIGDLLKNYNISIQDIVNDNEDLNGGELDE